MIPEKKIECDFFKDRYKNSFRHQAYYGYPRSAGFYYFCIVGKLPLIKQGINGKIRVRQIDR